MRIPARVPLLPVMYYWALREKFTTQHHIHRQMVGFSRLGLVGLGLGLGLGLVLGLGLGLGGANLNRKTLGAELLPEHRIIVCYCASVKKVVV